MDSPPQALCDFVRLERRTEHWETDWKRKFCKSASVTTQVRQQYVVCSKNNGKAIHQEKQT